MKKFKLTGRVAKWLGWFLNDAACRPTNICSLLWSVGWRVVASLFAIVVAVMVVSLWTYANYCLLSAFFVAEPNPGAMVFAAIFDAVAIVVFSFHVHEQGWPKWLRPIVDKVTDWCPEVEWDDSE